MVNVPYTPHTHLLQALLKIPNLIDRSWFKEFGLFQLSLDPNHGLDEASVAVKLSRLGNTLQHLTDGHKETSQDPELLQGPASLNQRISL